MLGILALFFLFTIPLAVYIAQQRTQSESLAATPTDAPQVCDTNPQDISLVIDNSSSMLDTLDDGYTTRLDEVKKAAHAFVDKIRTANSKISSSTSKFRVSLFRFSDFSNTSPRPPGYDGPMNTALVRKLTSNMDDIDSGIDSLNPPEYMGWTCVACGLEKAYDELSRSGRDTQDKTVVVFTDGIANWRTNTTDWVLPYYGDSVDYPDDTHPIARQAAYKQITNNPGITLYAVGTADSQVDFINKMASLGGTGSGKYTSNPRGLTSIFSDIASELITKGQGVITGTVFEDTHDLGTRDADEEGKQGILVAVYDANGKELKRGTTDSNGQFSITGLCSGTYTIKTLDKDWSATTTNPVKVPVGSSRTGSFIIGVHYQYTIKGKVYVDNGDGRFDVATDMVYPGPVKINYDGAAPITTASFSIPNVTQGSTHTITLDPSSVSGYTIKPGSVYTVTLSTYPSSGCPPIKPSAYINYGYSCAKHSLVLNFLLSGKPVAVSSSWLQSETLDVRVDGGYDYPVPAGTSCPAFASLTGDSTTPGIIFSGTSDPKFGSGQASVKNWVVGDGAYPEVFGSTKPQKLSYDSAYAASQKAGTMREAFTFGSSTSPGIYHFADALVITDKIHIVSGEQYVLLVEDGVDIENEITVDPGGFLLIVSKTSISISGTIGTTPSCSSATTQLDGIFVADDSITFESAKTCTDGGDIMVQASGTFVTNAGRTGGEFVQKRVLCGSNTGFPPVRVLPRLDMLLNFPNFLKSTSRIWQEVAP